MKVTHRPILLILVGAALLIPVITWIWATRQTPSQNEYVAEMFAKNNGLSKDEVLRVEIANDNLSQGKPSEEDFGYLEKMSFSEHLEFRATSCLKMTHALGTKYEERARKLCRRLATDADPGTRMLAIFSLVKMKDQEASALIESARTSTDPFIVAQLKKLPPTEN